MTCPGLKHVADLDTRTLLPQYSCLSTDTSFICYNKIRRFASYLSQFLHCLHMLFYSSSVLLFLSVAKSFCNDFVSSMMYVFVTWTLFLA